MLKNIISKKIVSHEDFLSELKNNLFNEIKLNQALKSGNIDLNWTNENSETFLHLCCKGGYYESIKWLIENGCDIEAQTNEGNTPIFYAIQSKSRAVLSLLIENKANVDHLNIYKRTALQEAVLEANNKFIDILLEKTTLINNCDIHGNNLIFDAIANGNEEIIIKIAKNKKVNLNQMNEDGQTVLYKDLVIKSTKLALELLDCGANPTIMDKSGKNFLFYAVSKGFKNIDIIHKAVEKGCNLNSKSSENENILMESVKYYLQAKDDNEEKNNHLEMIKELIKLGLNICDVDNNGENILFYAVKAFDEALIDLILDENKIDLYHLNNNNEDLFSILLYEGIKYSNLIDKFLSLGIDLDKKNIHKQTIIEILIDIILHFHNGKKIDEEIEKKLNESGNFLALLELILQNHKCNLKILNSKGEPLFFDTIFYFNFKLFKILRKHEIDINQKDINGNNILFKIMESKDPETKDELKIFLNTLQSLINIGVNINETNNDGQTILHKAVCEKNEYVFKFLVEAKANLQQRDKLGRTVAHMVILKNRGLRYLKLINHFNKELLNVADYHGITPLNYAAFMGKIDFVIYMLDEGVVINNTNKIENKMIKFFEKFHNTLLNLPNQAQKEVDKININILVDTMKKEFNVKN